MTPLSVATPTVRALRLDRRLVERASAAVILAGVAAWLLVNLAHNPAQFFSVAMTGLSNGALYALVALGYTLVYGIIELINFAHGDLFMLGTLFTGFMLTKWLGVTHQSWQGWLAFAFTLIAAMAFCGGINAAIEFLAYRRLRRAPKLAPLITAVGMSFILQFVGLKWNGSTPKQWPSVLPLTRIDIGGIDVSESVLVVLPVTAALLAAMSWLVTKTKQGKAMRATAQDQDAARLMGIDVNRTISFTFLLGGALAGAAGVMYNQTNPTTVFNLGFKLGLVAFTAAVLGGIGNLTGAVIGGLLIGLMEGLNEGLPYALGTRWSDTVVFAALILVMVFKPEGLLGRPTTEKV